MKKCSMQKKIESFKNKTGTVKKQEYRVKPIKDSMDVLEKQGFDRGFLQDIALEMYDMGCSKDFIARHFERLNDDGWLDLCVKKGYYPYQIANKLSNMGA